MTKNACLIVLLFLGGCAAQPRTAIVKKTSERPELKLIRETELVGWMKHPEWWQKLMPPEPYEQEFNRPYITLDTKFYPVFEYEKFRDSNPSLQSVLSSKGHSIIGGDMADRFRELTRKLDTASYVIAPGPIRVDNKHFCIAHGESVGVGVWVNPVLTLDGRVRIRFSARHKPLGCESHAGSKDHYFDVSGEPALVPGQLYVKVVELQELDMATIFVLSIPMIRYPDPDQQAQG